MKNVGCENKGSSSAENGTFMKHALQNCATVDEFEQLLIETNSSGRETKSISAGTGGTTDPSPGTHIYDSGARVSITANFI